MKISTVIVGVIVLSALPCCDRTPGQGANVTANDPVTAVAPKSAPTQALAKATDRDPSALDEGLSDALLELQDKFKCNRISGCAAHRRVVDYGRSARPHVERQFARASHRAPWRSRLVQITAQLQDPSALPFLVAKTRDRDDEVVAYALYGLALLDYKEALERVKQWADAGAGLQFGMARLSARWTLARWRQPGASQSFLDELAARCRQMLAASTVRWGLQLCGQSSALDCSSHRALAAKHPGFVARREVVRQLEKTPLRTEIPTMVMLAADPISSIRRRAIALLVQLTGRADLQDGKAWRHWCDFGGCAPSVDTRKGQRQATRPTATP